MSRRTIATGRSNIGGNRFKSYLMKCDGCGAEFEIFSSHTYKSFGEKMTKKDFLEMDEETRDAHGARCPGIFRRGISVSYATIPAKNQHAGRL